MLCRSCWARLGTLTSKYGYASSRHYQTQVQTQEIPRQLTLRSSGSRLPLPRDPLQLANSTRDALRSGKIEKAFAVVRAASKDVKCTVSWNHLINYQIQRGQVKASFKTYNEMKKRAQKPDAYTYTILLRGLADHPEYGNGLQKALAVYHSMSSERSSVKPSITHTNATLKVCSRARDSDAMWSVISAMPESGAGAPDAVTYTTLLNALRFHATNYLAEESEWEKRGRRIRGVRDARRIWDDVTRRWTEGELQMDEELVCAMGRILLMGRDRRDWDDVLSLLEQTMNISRQTELATTSDPQREKRMDAIDVAKRQLRATDKEQSDVKVGDEQERESAMAERQSSKPWYEQRQFQPIKTSGKEVKMIEFARPSSNTLTLVLEACQAAHGSKVATAYWDLLTSQTWRVTPDLEAYHAYLRVLRVSRSSARVLHLVRDKLLGSSRLLPGRKTFLIALSACKRDNRNPSAFEHADDLIDLMARTMADPDIDALVAYLDLAASDPKPERMLHALTRLNEHMPNLQSMIYYGRAEDMRWPSDHQRAATIVLVRRMVAAHDKLIKAGVRRSGELDLANEKRRLAQFIARADKLDQQARQAKANREPTHQSYDDDVE